MEYIYAPIKEDNPYTSRGFEFILDGKVYNCQFKSSSERLMTLSKYFIPFEEESTSGYRNLWFYNMYVHPKLREHFKLEEDFFKNRTPISFFISGFEKFEEEKIVAVSKHINFYMSYYDRKSPTIIFHSAKTEQSDKIKELQLIGTEFPKNISSSQKDPFLLDLYLAAYEAQTRLRFIYYYQILEYAAFHYIDAETKQKIMKIIVSPDIHAYPERYIDSMVEILSGYREQDEDKINKIVDLCCSPEIIWNEISENFSYFTQKQEFDGGFFIEPFVSEEMTLNSFSRMWTPKIPVTLRKIRNALVHARESKLGSVISPSLENDIKLRPWNPIIRRIAEQVLISC